MSKNVNTKELDANTQSKMIEMPIYEPSPGDRVRIVIYYDGRWRPILWFRVHKDGSIYVAPRIKPISNLRKGRMDIKGESTSIKYSDGQDIIPQKGSKVSFHASGEIKSEDELSFRDAIRNLKEQQEYCWVLFHHPSQYISIDDTEIRDRDVCLRYPIDEERPLQGRLFVAPLMNAKFVPIASAIHQINLMFHITGLDGVPDLCIQLVLSNEVKGVWPPSTYLMYVARKEKNSRTEEKR